MSRCSRRAESSEVASAESWETSIVCHELTAWQAVTGRPCGIFAERPEALSECRTSASPVCARAADAASRLYRRGVVTVRAGQAARSRARRVGDRRHRRRRASISRRGCASSSARCAAASSGGTRCSTSCAPSTRRSNPRQDRRARRRARGDVGAGAVLGLVSSDLSGPAVGARRSRARARHGPGRLRDRRVGDGARRGVRRGRSAARLRACRTRRSATRASRFR